MIPGSNLLNMAFGAIAQQTVAYYVNTGRTANSIGMQVPSFAAPVNVRGSFQPVPRSKYEYMGLDFQKNYFNFYVSRSVIDLARGVAGDQLVFNGKKFQCESKTDWFGIDGWDAVLCVEIGNA